ncbi:hypothetical protein BCS42_10395 [Crenothrix sp. D3]|jgi:hypothetical protein|nr:hypothetical protein BCS42_10395 [Crenothrix sp. D3]
MKNITLSDENLRDIKIVFEYLLDSERKSYEEYCGDLMDENVNSILDKDFYNNPEINHIYAFARRVKDTIDSQL